MDGWLYAGYTLFQAVFWGIIWRLWRRVPTLGLLGVLVIVSGLVYDNAILALGSTIGVGSLLESLSWLRFLLHALWTPLLGIYGLDVVSRAGVAWVNRIRVRGTLWLLTGGLIALGFFTEYGPLKLQPTMVNGVTRYAATEQHGPPLAAIGVTVVLLVFGAVLWRRCGWRWLFGGALAMFIGSGLAGSLKSPVLGSAFEVGLIWSLLATERWLQARTLATETAASPQVESGALTA